jgi:hypothetical protein
VLEKFVDDQYAMQNLPESHSAFEDKVTGEDLDISTCQSKWVTNTIFTSGTP